MLSLISAKKRAQSHIGVSITPEAIAIAVFHKKSFSITHGVTCDLPPGVISSTGDEVLNPSALAGTLVQAVQQLGVSLKTPVHLSIPCTLLRVLDAPKILPKQLMLVLSSEAEQYKSFDNTEAVVDFAALPQATKQEGAYQQAPANTQRTIFGALRKDALEGYIKALSLAKIKIASVDMEPLSILRAMAGTGVLGSLMQQIGPDAVWGNLFVEPDRVRFFLWQADQLLDLREVLMDTRSFEKNTASGTANESAVTDLLEEIRRSTKNHKPVIWLTDNLVKPMQEALAGHLQMPFHTVMVGPTMGGSPDKVNLAAVGSALSSEVTFPFGFDFYNNSASKWANVTAIPGPPVASGKVVSGPGTSENDIANWLPTAGLAACVLMTLVWGGLSLYGGILGGQANDLDTKRQAVEGELATLSQQVEIAKKKYGVQAELLDLAKNARIQNIVYQKLAEDLKYKTPTQLWLNNIEVGSTIALEGKSLHHEAVIALAKSFDGVPYANSVMIDSIKESLLNNATAVYDFKIGGQVNKNPDLIEEDSPTASVSDTSPVGKSGATTQHTVVKPEVSVPIKPLHIGQLPQPQGSRSAVEYSHL